MEEVTSIRWVGADWYTDLACTRLCAMLLDSCNHKVSNPLCINKRSQDALGRFFKQLLEPMIVALMGCNASDYLIIIICLLGKA